MKHSLFFHSKICIAACMLFAAAACNLGEPTMEGVYSSVRYSKDAYNCLMTAMDSAKVSIRLALNTFTGVDDLIAKLNDRAVSGVTNQVVISAANVGTASGLSVTCKSGNAGNMYSNFAIIDDDFVVFFSDCALDKPSAIAVTVRHRDLIRALNIEFWQMFEKAQYGADKQSLVNPDTQVVFRTFSGLLDMYLLPRAEDYSNDVIGFICTRVRQAQKSVDVYAASYGNPVLNDTLRAVQASSGLSANFYSGGMASTPTGLTITKISDDPLYCNVILIDEGTVHATAIITTFPFAAASILNASDGVALFVRGEIVSQIKASFDEPAP